MSKKENRRIKLDLLHSFGAYSIKNSCHFIEQDDNLKQIIFPVGKYLAIKEKDQQQLKFLLLNEKIEKIITMQLAPNSQFIAISEYIDKDDEKFKKYPTVNLYNLKPSEFKHIIQSTRKQIGFKDSTASCFNIINFSSDSKYMICVTEEPETKLVYFDLTLSKKVVCTYTIGVPCSNATVCPNDNNILCISGPNLFKLLKIKENTMYPDKFQKIPQNCDIVDHQWLGNRIIVATDKGEILIIADNEVKQYINNAFEDRSELKVSLIIPFSKGFIITSQKAYFGLWIKPEDNINNDQDYFFFMRGWNSERNFEIDALSISKDEEQMLIAYRNNDIAIFDLKQVIPQTPEQFAWMMNQRTLGVLNEKKVGYEFLYNGFHSGPITGMDICIQRPLFVTCCEKDSTVRVWNYIKFKCELVRKFISFGLDGEEVQLGDEVLQEASEESILKSIAIHPSGYYLAIGFIDKLRIYHILNTELRLYNLISIKNVYYIKFSNGGKFLAAAYPRQIGSYHQQIGIYESYTLEFLISLKGHQNIIKDIIFNPTDSSMYSCGLDGRIYEWSTEKWIRRDRNLKQNTQFTSMLFNQNLNMVLAAGGENHQGVIQEIVITNNDEYVQKKDENSLFELNRYRIASFEYIRSLRDFHGIIAGTSQGFIKVFPHIFTGVPFETIQCHMGACTFIKASIDGRFVISSGEDGAIFIFQVTDMMFDGQIVITEDINTLSPYSMCIDENLADIILMNRNELEQYTQKIAKQQQDYEKYKLEKDHQIMLDQNRFRMEKENLIENYEGQLEQISNELENMKKRKLDGEEEFKNFLQDIEAHHLKSVEELEQLYERKVFIENEKFIQQEQEMTQHKIYLKNEQMNINQRYDQNIQFLKQEFETNFMKAHKVFSSATDKQKKLQILYETKIEQQADEQEQEISQLTNENSRKNQSQLEEIARLKGKEESYKNQIIEMNKSKEKVEKDIKLQEEQVSQSKNEIHQLQVKIDNYLSEIKQKEESMKIKDRKINEYKYQINDLQKSKHVLTFRTTEMRKSLEPKENQIANLKEELFKVESEFQSMLKASQLQNDKMRKLESQNASLRKNLSIQSEQTKKAENQLNKVYLEIYNLVQKVDPKNWNFEIKRLYQVFINQMSLKTSENDSKGLEEMQRQIFHLEKSIKQVNTSTEKMIIRREEHIQKKTKENAELLYDLMDLRKNNKQYHSELKNQKQELVNQKKQNTNIQNELQRVKIHNKSGLLEVESEQIEQPQLEHSISMGVGMGSQFPKIPQKNIPGRIIKGSIFDQKTLGHFEKAKILDLVSELELTQQKVLQQEDQIASMKNHIRQHLQLKKCQDDVLELDL